MNERFYLERSVKQRRWDVRDSEKELKDAIWIQESTHDPQYLVYINGKVYHRGKSLPIVKNIAVSAAREALKGGGER